METHPYYKYAFEFKFSPNILETCRFFKQKYGWREFGFIDGKWRFNRLDIATELIRYYPSINIPDEIRLALIALDLNRQESSKQAKQANEIKNAIESSLKISGLKHELYDYQKSGVEFFINNNGKAILAFTMGLGKTATALGYVVHTQKKKTLVICPASVKYVWEQEVEKWTKLSTLTIDGSFSNEELASKFDEHDVFIINYDILRKFMKFLSWAKWDCLIADEFHFIKNNAAQRTKIVKMIARKIQSILLLSGTPLLSRPVELFNGLNLMDPDTWNNWRQFTIRYCNGHQGYFGWDARGSSNIDELQKRIGKYFLRKTKDEVLTELPPKRYINYPVELDAETRKKYQLATNSFLKYLHDVKKKRGNELKRAMNSEQLVKLGEIRQITTMGKIDAAEEIISNVLDSGEKIVVFSCYTEPLEILHEKFKKESVILTGKSSSEQRSGAIEKFQNDSKTKIFFGGIKSAGIGITLTAGTNVLFIDYSWVPADHAQAEDRIHRHGQKADSVTIYQLYSRNTIDEYMIDMLSKKRMIFDKLIEHKETGGQMMIDDIIKKMEKK